MPKIASILAIVDPTAPRQPAVDKATWLARRLGARLELLACATEGDCPSGLMPTLVAPLRELGLQVDAHELAGAPLHEMLLARLHGAPVDLVVKDTHPHSLPRRTLFTNTDWRLIRGCAQPLLLVKPRPWAERPVILAAVDPGHAADPGATLDRRILEFAAALGGRIEGRVRVANAFFPSTIATAAGSGMPPAVGVSVDALRAESERRRAEIVALAAPYGVGAEAVHVEPGMARDFLPRIAEESAADIVVMGAIARGGLKRALLGSTAERVLEFMPSDLLVVKGLDFGAALPF